MTHRIDQYRFRENFRRTPLFQSCLLAIALSILLPAISSAADVRFNEHIRPILAEHCLHCHGPDSRKREPGLRLDIERLAKEHAIVPGHPEKSELFLRLTSTEFDQRMPPPETGKKLSDGQVRLIRQWILDGARFEGHWAFEPISNPAVPAPGDAVATEIDRFVVSRLELGGLGLSPPVSRQQLLRRRRFSGSLWKGHRPFA